MKHKQKQHTLKCYSLTIKYHNWKNDQWNTRSSGRYKEGKWTMKIVEWEQLSEMFTNSCIQIVNVMLILQVS